MFVKNFAFICLGQLLYKRIFCARELDTNIPHFLGMFVWIFSSEVDLISADAVLRFLVFLRFKALRDMFKRLTWINMHDHVNYIKTNTTTAAYFAYQWNIKVRARCLGKRPLRFLPNADLWSERTDIVLKVTAKLRTRLLAVPFEHG